MEKAQTVRQMDAERRDRARLKRAAKSAATHLLTVSELAHDRLSGEEKDAIGLVRYACHEIADGDREQ